jgi:hypothetical protein
LPVPATVAAPTFAPFGATPPLPNPVWARTTNRAPPPGHARSLPLRL